MTQENILGVSLKAIGSLHSGKKRKEKILRNKEQSTVQSTKQPTEQPTVQSNDTYI